MNRAAIVSLLSSALLCAPSICNAAQGADTAGVATIDPLLQQLVEQWPLPGLAISIVSRDATIHEAGYGERAVGKGEPVDAQTLFRINSMTKAMSATVIGMLNDSGVMSFEEPVTTHLPWFRVQDAAVSQQIRISDLLTHRSGVFCNDWLDDVPHITWEEGVRRFRFMPQAAPFRTQFNYCDWGYGVASLAMASAAGGWDTALKSRLFEPLGMRRTYTEIGDVIEARGIAACHECELVGGPIDPSSVTKVPNVAVPHFDVNGTLQATGWRRIASRGGSSVLSSAHDVGKLLQLYLRDGKVDGRQLVSSAALREILTPRIMTKIDRGPPDLPGFATEYRRSRFWDAGYGYGWHAGRYDDERVLWHGGNSLGFESLMVLLPDRGIGFVILINYSHANRGGLETAAMSVLDRLLGLPPLDWAQFHKARNRQQSVDADARLARLLASPEAKVTDTVATSVVGSYCSPAYGTLHVKRESSGLRLDQGPERWARLAVHEDGTFLLRWNGPRDQPRPVMFRSVAGAPAAAVTINGSEFERCAADTGKKNK